MDNFNSYNKEMQKQIVAEEFRIGNYDFVLSKLRQGVNIVEDKITSIERESKYLINKASRELDYLKKLDPHNSRLNIKDGNGFNYFENSVPSLIIKYKDKDGIDELYDFIFKQKNYTPVFNGVFADVEIILRTMVEYGSHVDEIMDYMHFIEDNTSGLSKVLGTSGDKQNKTSGFFFNVRTTDLYLSKKDMPHCGDDYIDMWTLATYSKRNDILKAMLENGYVANTVYEKEDMPKINHVISTVGRWGQKIINNPIYAAFYNNNAVGLKFFLDNEHLIECDSESYKNNGISKVFEATWDHDFLKLLAYTDSVDCSKELLSYVEKKANTNEKNAINEILIKLTNINLRMLGAIFTGDSEGNKINFDNFKVIMDLFKVKSDYFKKNARIIHHTNFENNNYDRLCIDILKDGAITTMSVEALDYMLGLANVDVLQSEKHFIQTDVGRRKVSIIEDICLRYPCSKEMLDVLTKYLKIDEKSFENLFKKNPGLTNESKSFYESYLFTKAVEVAHQEVSPKIGGIVAHSQKPKPAKMRI